MNIKTKKITAIAMLCAIAYVVMVIGRIPIVLFLKYDPKDVIVTIGGFIFGPMSAFIISLVVSTIEMFTVSDTGIIGWIMNILSTCAFACTAAFVYKKKHTVRGAIGGLVIGAVLMTAIMLLWNYFIVPLYLGYERDAVAALLLPYFLPFNLMKGGLNAVITLLIYKPIVNTLRKSQLIPESETSGTTKKINLGVTLVSFVIFITLILFALVLKGVI